jgi:hypothetical protein
MAGQPGSSKWDLTNWTSGTVTLFQALGIKKGTISYPPLQTELTTPAAEAAQSSGSAAAAGAAAATGANEAASATTGATGTGQAAGSTTAAGRGSGGGNTNTPAGSSEVDWVKTLLTALNAPQTNANINSLIAWINVESPWNSSSPDGALYTNNPLNTTQPASGATSINSDGVKKYTTAAEGIAATVATIIQYPQILAALRSGKGLCGSSLASSFAKWSGKSATNPGYTSVC